MMLKINLEVAGHTRKIEKITSYQENRNIRCDYRGASISISPDRSGYRCAIIKDGELKHQIIDENEPYMVNTLKEAVHWVQKNRNLFR